MDVLAVINNATHLELPVALACLAVVSLLLGRVLQNQFSGSRPPVFEGIPFIGGLLKFIGGPMRLMETGYATYGECFTVPVAHKRVTFLIGPDVSPHFFKATDDEMSQTEVYDFNVPTFGKGVVYDVDQKVRTEQFRFFAEALKKDRMKKYVPMFAMEAEQYLSKWGQEGVVDLKDEFSQLVALTAARTLLGREIREQLFDQVADLLHDLDDGMRPISVFLPYLPTAFHKKRDMYQNVNGGRQLTEEEITGLMIAVLFAGQHTSSITSSWTGLYMIDNKSTAMAAAIDEQKAIMAKFGDDLSIDVLSEMEVLHRNITEALRMHPPLLLVMRYAKQPFSVTTSKGKTYTIPKGDIVAASPNFSHMLPTVFTRPEAYEPDRFAAPRDEDKQKPYSFIGFGGGRHACIGSTFAYLQIKSIWSVMLRNFDFELIDPVPDADYDSMVIGPKACRVRFTRCKLQAPLGSNTKTVLDTDLHSDQ
eukprot:jgi/Chrzof1/12205/Cz06g25080.t1